MKFLVVIFMISSALADASLCKSYFQSEILLVLPTDTIQTPESRETVAELVVTLKKYQRLSRSEASVVAKIYSSIQDKIGSAILEGEAILKSQDFDQERVSTFFRSYSFIIDYAIDFTNEVGRYADGFNSINHFTNKNWKAREEEFTRFRAPPLEKFLPKFADVWKKKNQSMDLNQSYIISGEELNTDEIKIPFQYQYVFRIGLLTLEDLFRDRESGKVYVGVGKTSHSPYDGQFGDSDSFSEHDLFHAFVMKYRDYLLFEKLRAKTLDQMKSIKKINQTLYLRFLEEFDSVPEGALKDAIRVLLFGLMHEQGHSYPVGVAEQLENLNRKEFYLRAGASNAAYGTLGQDIQVSLRGRERAMLEEAMEWLLPKVERDRKIFEELYSYQ